VILVDTSVWIDHFNSRDPLLFRLLSEGTVVMHPLVRGELAMGNLSDRTAVLFMLSQLPRAVSGKDFEVLGFIEAQHLFGRGISYIDVHLLVSALLTPHTQLWTRDRRLRAAATQLGLAYPAA
jgi:predicted nucleic acid-binding protein